MTRGVEPVRTCVGCRVRAPKSELLRVVAAGDEPGTLRLVPDPHGRLPGRGAHLHPRADCLDLAERRRAFVRALRLPAAPSSEALRRQVEHDAAAAPTPTGRTTTMSAR